MVQPNPWTEERLAKVRRLIQSLYAIVKELDEEFVAEGRTFTPDGTRPGQRQTHPQKWAALAGE